MILSGIFIFLILLLLLVKVISFLARLWGGITALLIFFHLFGFLIWLIFMIVILEKRIKNLHIKGPTIFFYVTIHLGFFLLFLPYNYSQITLLSILCDCGRLLLANLIINCIYFFLISKVKSKKLAWLFFIQYPVMEIVSLAPAIYGTVALSVMFS